MKVTDNKKRIFGNHCEEKNSTEGLAFQKDDDKSEEV